MTNEIKNSATAANQSTQGGSLQKADSAASAMTMLYPVARPPDLIKYHEEVSKLIQDSMTKGIDYGLIPGTGDKPTLLKPGAERLCLAFGASPRYEIVTSDIDHNAEIKWTKRKKDWNNKDRQGRPGWIEEQGISFGLYRFVVRSRIERPDGRILGEGIGVCSTMESKYIDRPRDCENTALKMAQKRALVAAVLNAFALSNRFTQDVEEFTDVEPESTKGKISPPAKDEHLTSQEKEKQLADKNAAIGDFMAMVKEFESKGGDIKATLKMAADKVIMFESSRIRAATQVLTKTLDQAVQEASL